MEVVPWSSKKPCVARCAYRAFSRSRQTWVMPASVFRRVMTARLPAHRHDQFELVLGARQLVPRNAQAAAREGRGEETFRQRLRHRLGCAAVGNGPQSQDRARTVLGHGPSSESIREPRAVRHQNDGMLLQKNLAFVTTRQGRPRQAGEAGVGSDVNGFGVRRYVLGQRHPDQLTQLASGPGGGNIEDARTPVGDLPAPRLQDPLQRRGLAKLHTPHRLALAQHEGDVLWRPLLALSAGHVGILLQGPVAEQVHERTFLR